MDLYQVIKSPIVTEKSMALREITGRYTFEVNVKATKTQIKAAMKTIFNVDAIKVRTTIVHEEQRRRTFGMVKPSNWKKAIVELKAGQSINLPGEGA
jgi:large subunit ribosomal protein L23